MAFPLFHPEDPRDPPLFLDAAEFAREFPIESDVLERKQGLGADPVQDAVVAFSNSRGGVVLFGVADDGLLVGMPLTQRVTDRLHQAIGGVRNPGRYSVRALTVGEVEITVLAVERRVEGFAQTSSGRILVRVGPRNVALFDTELSRFVRDRSFHRFEITDAEVPLAAANPSLVADTAEAYGWTDPATYEDRLRERALLLDNGNLTVAGALSLLDRPDEHLGKAFVEILRFPDEETGDYDRRVEVHGPVTRQVERVATVIQEELGSELVVVGLERHELPRLPLVVLREAVANAVGHRSYELNRTAVRVELRPHQVKIVSPGGLPAPVTVDNIREAQAARNMAVIDGLRRRRLAEDAGRGVDVMQDSMRAEMLDQPTFADTGHSVEVSLPIRGPVTARERAWVREIERRGDIEPADRILLVHAARGETLTNAAARRISGLDRIDATRALQRLRAAGFLVQQGERGGSSYVLDGSLQPPAGLRLTPGELQDVVVGLAADGPITNASVRERTGLDRAAALRLLDVLVADGRLARVGERRGTRYVARERTHR
jgi:ATP-dependent DNA helicase RecG